jgi:ferredoxin-NADP reductase
VRESRSIVSFVLEPVDGEPLPAFRPGQFLTVRVQTAGAPRALCAASRSRPRPTRAATASASSVSPKAS